MAQHPRSYEIDMVNGPILPALLRFAVPLMCSSILQLLFNAADIVVVGRFAGTEALAAVGSNTSLINLMINLFVGLSVGTNVVVARDLGAGRNDNVRRSVHTSVARPAKVIAANAIVIISFFIFVFPFSFKSQDPVRIVGSSINGMTPTCTIPLSSASGGMKPSCTTILRKKSPLLRKGSVS